jgi:hypothetical protein
MRLSLAGTGAAAVTGRGAVVGLALAGGTVAYLRSFPEEIPKKDPADKRCARAAAACMHGRLRRTASGGSQPPPQRCCCFRCCCAAPPAAAAAKLRARPPPPRALPRRKPRLVLDRSLMEAICGAVGEVAQVVVLYPLETIKVKCQAEGVGAATAVRAVLASGPRSALRALYSGIGAAAICSVIVGAVHYASFCMSKRAAMAATNGGGGGGGEPSTGLATAIAAVVGAVSTALVESPCDLYRHMAQVGGRCASLVGWLSMASGAGFAPCRLSHSCS